MRSVRCFTSVRFFQDFRRLRVPAGNCFRGSRRVHPILVLRTAALHSIVAPHCGVARCSRISVMPTRAVSSTRDVPAHQPLDLVGDSSGQVQKRTVTGGRVQSGTKKMEHTSTPCVHLACPVLVMAALETRAREDLMILPEESASFECHAEEYKVIVTVARALSQGGCGGHVRQLTTWDRVYALLEATENDSGPDLTGGWPKLGLSVPHARPDAHRAPVVASSVIAQHEEVAALEAVKASSSRPPPRRRSGSRTSTLSTTTARKSKFALR